MANFLDLETRRNKDWDDHLFEMSNDFSHNIVVNQLEGLSHVKQDQWF